MHWMHHMKRCCGPMHKFGGHRPIKAGIGLLLFAASTTLSIWLSLRLISALETMTLVKALDEMDNRLSDVEKADLEGRIREKLF